MKKDIEELKKELSEVEEECMKLVKLSNKNNTSIYVEEINVLGARIRNLKCNINQARNKTR